MKFLLITVAIVIGGEAHAQSTSLSQETQARGYWVDPSTSFMWAAKDNGEDVSWKKATLYCQRLRIAGYSDWRLASLEEMRGIYDQSANSPGLMGAKRYHNVAPSTWHVKGGLYLTGEDWTSTRRYDDRGKPSGYAWRFDFNDGRDFGGDEESFAFGKRALCVRSSRVDMNDRVTSSSVINHGDHQ